MSERLRRLVALVLLVSISVSFWPGTACAQEGEDDRVAQLMARMSPAAKVGQLFLVTFPGSAVTEDAAVTELIREYRVGGVLLKPENGNIDNEADTPTQVATLVNQLQEASWKATQPVTETETASPSSDPFVPLFIAVNHEGNGMPHTDIVSGTTPLPSQMALGATWNLSHAHTIGQIAGRELSIMGVNMLLGPSLDVLEEPRPESAGDLGVRSFGGDAFWVGEMGKAYIQGVHEEAEGRVAVVPKHFPGLGTSERSLDREISTVQRTLEKLKQVDLAPFFAVAQADNDLAHPEGMMVSHIRFRGLEGGRFVTTDPISVDTQVLQRLLELPALSGWREAGGVTVSDELGLGGLRRFYDPSGKSFNGRRIAREAFLAGNDILLLSQFALNGSWEERIDNIKSTIDFFREKYENEPSFRTRVDAAVARILRLKLSLYGDDFSLTAAQQQDLGTLDDKLEPDVETVASIARDAITLLSPPSQDLVPSPPTSEDNIVIFTDDQTGQPCASCDPVPYIDPFRLENTIVRLYGPDGTGQIDPAKVRSFTFTQLEEYLNAPSPTPAPQASEGVTPTLTPVARPSLASALGEADWLVFAMLDPLSNLPGSGAKRKNGVVQRFLAERADALSNPRLVVLAYDAPYYLDATEISKLHAYYAAYSRENPFIEASVRALFGEFAPAGDPPVGVSGVNYSLMSQTSPDPQQTIPLYYERINAPAEEGQPTPGPTEEGQQTPEATREGEATPEPRLEKGDTLRLYTGKIVDRNGNPVPDGTPVQFIFTYPQEGLEHTELATTRGGVAETTYALERKGQLDISIQADPAPRTVALQVMIREGEPATVVTPTPSPTPTPTPTETPTPTPVIKKTASPAPTVEESIGDNGGEVVPPSRELGLLDLMLALVGALVVSGSGYYAMRFENGSAPQALRVALWCAVGGFAFYLAYALRLPGADWLRGKGGLWAAGGVAVTGGLVSLILVWILEGWRRR